MALSWISDTQMLGPTTGPSIDPWPAYAALRVLTYLDASSDQTTQTRLVQTADETFSSKDIRSAFMRPKRVLMS